MRDIRVGNEETTYILDVENNVKFGPRCKLENHYFHDMGCSPVHRKAELCAACHNWKIKTKRGELLPVFTTYTDWRESPYAKKGIQCQSCHMPGSRAELAEGSPERENVPHHGHLGSERNLRKRAAVLSVAATDAGQNVDVVVTVENSGSGHAIPSGLPARRLLLEMSVSNAAGDELARHEVKLGRILVDERGKVAPFFKAVRVETDSRIGPKETREFRQSLPAPTDGEVRVRLMWRPIALSIARVTGIEKLPSDEVLASLTIPVGAPGKDRKGLPAKVTSKR